MGIGLAMLCQYFGIRFICVVDTRTTTQNIKLLQAYGALIEVVEQPDQDTEDLLAARLRRVKTLMAEHKNSWWSNQYANTYNAYAHHRTMQVILLQLYGQVDSLFCAVSTCGTLRGCSDFI